MKGQFGNLAVLALIFGVMLSVLGWQETHVLTNASATPHDLTALELGEKGHGGNLHVQLKEFTLGDNYVVETKKDTWNRVWIPMFPADPKLQGGGYPPARILLKSFKPKNQQELGRLYEVTSLRGVITNDLHSIGTAEASELKRSYPKTDFDKIIVVEHEREVPTATKAYGMLGGGVALAVVGIALGIAHFVRR